MQNFKELKVWNEAHQITLEVYKVTRDFPGDERFGLTAQIRRACASIPANIAEGCGRASQRELAQFLHVAMGSANELQYHLLLAGELAYLPDDQYRYLDRRVVRVRQMLSRLLKKVRVTIRDNKIASRAGPAKPKTVYRKRETADGWPPERPQNDRSS